MILIILLGIGLYLLFDFIEKLLNYEKCKREEEQTKFKLEVELNSINNSNK